MATSSAKKNSDAGARPIRTERDYMGATSVAKQLRRQAKSESAAEQRLQALIHELDKFEAMNDDADPADDSDELYDGPRRRWSDEA